MNDDLLVEIFDFCRLDNISPNTYPRNWWYTLAHVCQRWRRVLFATPTRLGITLVCNSRTPVKDLLTNSPPLPLVIYWGHPGTLDTGDGVKSILFALGYRDRVRRMTLHMPECSLREVFKSMDGTFPMLETLQLYRAPDTDREPPLLPTMFDAPNLRHLQLTDLKSFPPTIKLLNNVTTRQSIVTLSLGEITIKPATLMEYLALMPRLKVLKIGVSFSIPSEHTERKEKNLCTGSQPKSPSLTLTDLEEFEYQGTSNYLEALAARIGVPFLKRLSITVSNEVNHSADLNTTAFKYLSRLISGAADLAFQFARVRFKDNFSIVMDHNELWTGRGAFEFKFNHRKYFFNVEIGLVANICRVVAPMPSTVQSLLLEDGHRNTWERNPTCEEWRKLLRVFGNVKTLRVAGRFVEELEKALKPDTEGLEVQTLLPRLQEIVRYGPENEFAAFVQARQVAGSPVRVVSGPQNRLTLF